MLHRTATWFGAHQWITVSLIVGIVLVLIAAMAFHYDLSFIADIARGWWGK